MFDVDDQEQWVAGLPDPHLEALIVIVEGTLDDPQNARRMLGILEAERSARR